ncbi:MAG: acylphosphatase [Candidatus Omnitrophota bacterium]
MTAQQVHVYYSGMVQGVGFRYQVRTIAAGCKVTGWVRNLVDGRVELVAEGAKETLENFLDQIDQSLGDYIRNKQLSWNKPEGCFKTFQIVF